MDILITAHEGLPMCFAHWHFFYMSIFSLTDAEKNEVRLQLGAYIGTDDITDDAIDAESILGAAADYVYERIINSIDESKVSGLPSDEQAAVSRARDMTAEDVSNFINVVLKPPQQLMFRRAIVYRCAGLCVALITRVTRETAGQVTQDIERQSIAERQQDLFNLADAEIDFVKNAFPDDIFIGAVRAVNPTIFSIVGS